MQAKELDKIKVFFILGRPRSGTTLLRTLFDAHSNVSIPYEGRIIMDLYFKYGKIKKWDKNKLLNFYDDITSINKVDAWEFNDDLKEQIISLGKEASFTRLIKLVYLNFKSLFKKEDIIIIGDKNPYYSIRKSYLKIIKNIFPDAKIIHLVRDYRAHYFSMTKMNFESSNYGVVASRWLYSYKIIQKQFKNTENYFLIKHEDITRNPKVEIQRICNFLELEFQPKMLEFYKIKDIVIQKYGEEALKDHSSLLNPITDKFNDKWKDNLSKNTIFKIEGVIGSCSETIGYQRIYSKKNKLLLRFIFYFYSYIYLFVAHIIDYMPLDLKRKISFIISKK